MSEYSKIPSFNSTALGSPITEFSFSLMTVHEGQRFASGTAIIIAPYLAVTAKHVIDDFWQKYHPKIPLGGLAGARFSLQAVHVIDGKSAAIWDVTKLWSAHYHDMAIIRLTPREGVPPDYAWKAPKIELMPPTVGDRIVGFGYHSTSVTIIENGESNVVKVMVHGATTVGEVIDVHPERRDSARLTFPCFQTNAVTGCVNQRNTGGVG